MRSKLQYIYSISVFLGVLVTSYLMMNKEGSSRVPLQAIQNGTQRVEATTADPAVQSLIEIENALRAFPKKSSETAIKAKRLPSRAE